MKEGNPLVHARLRASHEISKTESNLIIIGMLAL